MDLELVLVLAAATAILLVAGTALVLRRQARERRDHRRLAAAREQGLHLPVSLHPVIDPDVCIGSLACVAACPEGDVIGIVNGVGTLVEGANCVGHGRCAAECPVSAIKLVFGTSERGVDIPRVTSHYESTVPGIYVAGELGGMGLIRNAVRQGRSVIRHVTEHLPAGGNGDADDVVVIGAGPAGFAAALAAREAGLRFRVIEQDTFGGTVAHYPRQKIVLTEAIDLPLAGRIQRGNLAKEELIARWTALRDRHGLPIQESERAEDIRRADGAFRVVTSRSEYRARKVVLAIGRRGTPRRLGVPGEELPAVTYRLIEPEQYTDRPVLVVGGGDSAVEAACTLAEVGARVSLCHRGRAFDRCRPANRERIARLDAAGRVDIRSGTIPVRFAPPVAFLAPADRAMDQAAVHGRPVHAGSSPARGALEVPAEFVIVCAGGDLPTALLNRVGVAVDRHYGEPE